MYISFAESFARGFKRWSDTHPSAGNDNDGGDVPSGMAITVPESEIDYALMPSTEKPREPWLVPGMAHVL